jgi:hypothetical protein
MEKRTEHEIRLLMKELGARLHCGVMCRVDSGDGMVDAILKSIDYANLKLTFDYEYPLECGFGECIPYLRPITSICEEEIKAILDTTDKRFYASKYGVNNSKLSNANDGGWHTGSECTYVKDVDCDTLIDWMNEHHFDHRGLIGMGLALEAPKYLYPPKSMKTTKAILTMSVDIEFCSECPLANVKTSKGSDENCDIYCKKMKKNVYKRIPWNKTSCTARNHTPNQRIDFVPEECPFTRS